MRLLPAPFQPSAKTLSILCACWILAACQVSNKTTTSDTTSSPAPTTVSPVIDSSVARAAPIPGQAEQLNLEDESSVVYESAWERIHAGFQLQAYYQHAEVDAQLRNYANNQRLFDLIGTRAEPFLFRIVEEIEKRQLPMELALLPIVESTYNPRAHSSENAVGLWQILASTGRSLGLQQDWWYDARRDPESATLAALDYLQALYTQFDNNWMLALAAYNTGPGNVQRALRRSNNGNSDFWSLRLASETRYHVPRLLALARIVQDPGRFSVELPPIPNLNPVRRVDIGSQIDLIKVAEILEMEESELRALNPGYLQWATHPAFPQSITIPHDKEALLLSGLANLDRSQFVTWEHYAIRPGDTLSTIARRMNTTIDVLRVVNNLQGSRIIAGEALLIPRGSGAQDYASLQVPMPQTTHSQPVPEQYTIRSGDNLWLIARRFDLRSKEIASWNNIAIDTVLYPGQTLDLSFARTEAAGNAVTRNDTANNSYTVMRGDNPARIAQMFNLRLADLLRWNKLSSTSIIYPGQQLYVAPSR